MRRRDLVFGLVALEDWKADFPVDRKLLSPNGNNPYFPLAPGRQWTYSHGTEMATMTVLDETKRIDGVDARAVEVRETKGGQLVELTRDYFAVDRTTNDVYYFGEDVEVYKNGKAVNHEGAWLSGVNGAKFGLFLPGAPKAGMKFYQEIAPKIAMDRVEITGLAEAVVVPAGTFVKCLKVKETSQLEPLAVDYKWFSPGIGMVKDGSLELIKMTTGQ